LSSFFLAGLALPIPSTHFPFGTSVLDRSVPQVMGILNVTTDSFSDGGELLKDGRLALDLVIERARLMVEAGASMLDVGGESTRPGAQAVAEAEEADRVLPVIEALASRFDVVLSVDTSSPMIMQAAAERGAGLINDVRALTRPGALTTAAATGLPVCLMHMQGQPADMQDNPSYTHVLDDIAGFFTERLAACKSVGLPADRIILDPGFGFGKTFDNNLDLLGNLEHFAGFDLPLLVGMSRKRMLGTITGKSEKERLAAGLAAAVIAVMKGAWIVRTHDVGPTVDALKVCRALLQRSVTGKEEVN
jgi:dihydropteroate synthase